MNERKKNYNKFVNIFHRCLIMVMMVWGVDGYAYGRIKSLKQQQQQIATKTTFGRGDNDDYRLFSQYYIYIGTIIFFPFNFFFWFIECVESCVHLYICVCVIQSPFILKMIVLIMMMIALDDGNVIVIFFCLFVSGCEKKLFDSATISITFILTFI